MEKIDRYRIIRKSSTEELEKAMNCLEQNEKVRSIFIEKSTKGGGNGGIGSPVPGSVYGGSGGTFVFEEIRYCALVETIF